MGEIMPYELSEKLVIATSSSALFDTAESDAVFRSQGLEAYKRHQRDAESVPFGKGRAFPFIQRLLAVNDNESGFCPVEVILLSRNSAESGVRTMNSITHYGLPITRAVFRGGRPPWSFAKPLSASLYLSTNRGDVVEAIKAGVPGGYIMGTYIEHGMDDELRIAFDFDGLLADDSSEKVYQERGIEDYMHHETEHKDEPLGEGPLNELLMRIAAIQKAERERMQSDSNYRVRIRTAIVTARNAPAHSRAISSLRNWGVEVDELYFLGGIRKRDVLAEFRPHIFFDDQESWVTDASDVVASVHVPYGEVNDRLNKAFGNQLS